MRRRGTVLLTSLALLAASVMPAAATRDEDKPDWAIRCEMEGDKRCYLVQNVFLAENQQRLAGLALSRQGEGYLALVSVPLGVDLTAGAQLQVDEGPPLPVPYQVCDPQGCHGALMLPRDVLKSLKRAKKLTLRYQEPGGRHIGVPFSLKDFNHGLDTLKSTSPASASSHRKGDPEL
jgi:invasion protein IalB